MTRQIEALTKAKEEMKQDLKQVLDDEENAIEERQHLVDSTIQQILGGKLDNAKNDLETNEKEPEPMTSTPEASPAKLNEEEGQVLVKTNAPKTAKKTFKTTRKPRRRLSKMKASDSEELPPYPESQDSTNKMIDCFEKKFSMKINQLENKAEELDQQTNAGTHTFSDRFDNIEKALTKRFELQNLQAEALNNEVSSNSKRIEGSIYHKRMQEERVSSNNESQSNHFIIIKLSFRNVA